MLPSQHVASNKICRLLAKYDLKTHHLPVNKTTLMYGVYHVDVGRCISDKQEFRNQMQGAHAAPFPGPAREFGCSRMFHGYSTIFTEWLR
jgi:hypothetical protein